MHFFTPIQSITNFWHMLKATVQDLCLQDFVPKRLLAPHPPPAKAKWGDHAPFGKEGMIQILTSTNQSPINSIVLDTQF